jgi:hypothetical protein
VSIREAYRAAEGIVSAKWIEANDIERLFCVKAAFGAQEFVVDRWEVVYDLRHQ